MDSKDEEPDFNVEPLEIELVSYGPDLNPVLMPLLTIFIIGALFLIEYFCTR